MVSENKNVSCGTICAILPQYFKRDRVDIPAVDVQHAVAAGPDPHKQPGELDLRSPVAPITASVSPEGTENDRSLIISLATDAPIGAGAIGRSFWRCRPSCGRNRHWASLFCVRSYEKSQNAAPL